MHKENLDECRADIQRALEKINRNEPYILAALRTSKDLGIAGAATNLFGGIRRNLERALRELKPR